jgi:hypothetical protein
MSLKRRLSRLEQTAAEGPPTKPLSTREMTDEQLAEHIASCERCLHAAGHLGRPPLTAGQVQALDEDGLERLMQECDARRADLRGEWP